ncbi:MAG: PAS domain S-box protein [Acidobacteria bacterium]|nr:PAS domain S-box protein [Acidobacteriota bacterium]
MTSSIETNRAKLQRRETIFTHTEGIRIGSLPQFGLEEGLHSLLQQVGELLDFSASLIALRRYETEPLRIAAVNQTKTSLSQSELEMLCQSLSAGWALSRQQIAYLSQAQLKSEFYMLPTLTGIIYAPVLARGKGAGLVCLVNADPNHEWNGEVVELVRRLAHQAGLMTEMGRVYDDLRRCLSGGVREKEATLSLLATWEAMNVAQAQLGRDIWRLNQQVKTSEIRFQWLAECVQDAMVIIQDQRFRSINRRLTEIVGYSPDACYRMINLLDLVAENHRPLVAENHRKTLQGERVPPYEFVVRDIEGSEVVLEATGALIEFDGRPALLEVWRDVTRQRQLRAQLLLSEKMAAMGQLISGVAHELNNPLTAVLGFSELALMNSQLSDEQRRDLKTIVSEAHRARKIAQNLLSFAHTPDSVKRLSDVNRAIDQTMVLKEYELCMNHVEIIKQLDPHLPHVVADTDQLKQVFLNIIVNAEQAMLEVKPPRRMEIRTGVKTCYVAGSATDWVEIRFRDTGPGISAENLNRIFDLFFTTKELGKGTGLGLAISYNIIKEHGGRMSAQNAPGGGAEFIIELPVQTE